MLPYYEGSANLPSGDRRDLVEFCTFRKCFFFNLHYIIFYEVVVAVMSSDSHTVGRARRQTDNPGTCTDSPLRHIAIPQSRERSEAEAEAGASYTLQPQPYNLSDRKAGSRGRQ